MRRSVEAAAAVTVIGALLWLVGLKVVVLVAIAGVALWLALQVPDAVRGGRVVASLVKERLGLGGGR